jgi:hypothetical protein
MQLPSRAAAWAPGFAVGPNAGRQALSVDAKRPKVGLQVVPVRFGGGRMRRVIAPIAIVFVLLAGLELASPSSNGASAVQAAQTGVRYEFTFSRGPSDQCTRGPGSICAHTLLGLPVVTTPTTVGKVDIVLSLGLAYKSSPADAGNVFVDFDPHPGRTRHVMLRGPMPLPPAGRNATTLTWAERSLPARGQQYNFYLRASLIDDGDGYGYFDTYKIVAVIDIQPANADWSG